MIFVDTQYVLARVNPRDQHHIRAVELSKRIVGARMLITEPVLLEIGNAMARRFKNEAIDLIEHAQTSDDIQLIRLTENLFQRGLALYSSHRDKDWGLVDCISFVVMRDFGVTEALTHDEHFVQAGFRALLREGS
jgi:hypothetical protein